MGGTLGDRLRDRLRDDTCIIKGGRERDCPSAKSTEPTTAGVAGIVCGHHRQRPAERKTSLVAENSAAT